MKSFSCFKPRDPFKNWSKELDKRVAVWAKNFESSFILLLLGPAGAGKTTIMKQMKIIHFEGFSLEERRQKAKEIRTNLLESVRELTACITASGYQIDWCDKENQARLDFINGLNLDDQTYDLYAAKIYDYSKRILTDKGVEELFAQLNQLSITHRSQYLLNRVDEIRNANYIPNNDDILQSRRRTSDIQKLEFQVDLPVRVNGAEVEQHEHTHHYQHQQSQQHQHQQQQQPQQHKAPPMKQTFCMFDVGGQRGERRKWIQVFDGVSAVMFLIDSSSFDATDDENGKNKLKETINLFHEVWTTRFLLNSNFVLLFNKQDILREKIERGHKIEDHFPEYKLYKFQPNERHLNEKNLHPKTGAGGAEQQRHSLFRTISTSSSRQNLSAAAGSASTPPAAAVSPSSRNSPARSSFASISTRSAASQQQQAHDQGPTHATKQRKTASLYRFGTGRSRSFFGSKSTKSTGSTQPAAAVAAAAAATTSSASEDLGRPSPQPGPEAALRRSTRSRLGPETDATGDQAQGKETTAPGAGNRTEAAPDQHTNNHNISEHNHNSSRSDQDTHLAYIKARSFIRDKFLQITRQVDATYYHHDQRKFSSPNLPIYNQKTASAASSSRVDHPKRNVCYHYTTATDTENIRDLFENLQKMVIKSTMKDL